MGAIGIVGGCCLLLLAEGCVSRSKEEVADRFGTELLAAQDRGSTADSSAAEKETYLRSHIRADAVRHSFYAHEGVWIDCVDVNLQPTMLSREMTGQSAALPPPPDPLPAGHAWAHLDMEEHSTELDSFGNLRSCAPGTIPVRRTTADDLSRYATLSDFYAKAPNHAVQAPSLMPMGAATASAIWGPGQEYAHNVQSVANWGGQAAINIWQPYVQAAGEDSISQIWITNNSGMNEETIEAGWIVAPLKYPDNLAHFFVYSTNDGYAPGSGSCYNLDCPGFVQTNNSVSLGAWFSTVSIDGGTQYEVNLAWMKFGKYQDWWLLWQGTTWIGYYPATRFTHGMRYQADTFAYGGEIYDLASGGFHTTTQMGSGQYASAWWTYAAYQRHVQYLDLTDTTVDASPTAFVSNSCYTLSNGYASGAWGQYVFFGGPGYNGTTCP